MASVKQNSSPTEPAPTLSETSTQEITQDEDPEITSKKRKIEKESERLMNMIKSMKEQYDEINGKNAQNTERAARRLEYLGCDRLAEQILQLEDVNAKWEIAIELSDEVSYMILDADLWAGSSVNGKLGDWCPRMFFNVLVGMWDELLFTAKTEKPKDQIIKDGKQQVKYLLLGSKDFRWYEKTDITSGQFDRLLGIETTRKSQGKRSRR